MTTTCQQTGLTIEPIGLQATGWTCGKPRPCPQHDQESDE